MTTGECDRCGKKAEVWGFGGDAICEECSQKFLDLDALRARALSYHLGISESDLEVGGESVYVNPRPTSWGMSPDEAKERVDLIKRLLVHLGLPRYSIEELRDFITKPPGVSRYETLAIGSGANRFWLSGRGRILYNELKDAVKECIPDNEIPHGGPYHLISPLHDMLVEESDRDVMTMREAFDGLEIQDRRTHSTTDDGEYLVVTGDEADELWDADLENYIDDCVIPEIEYKSIIPYVDWDKFKDDLKVDGRAHSLASYDGEECQVGIEDILAPWEDCDPPGPDSTLYIYRRN